MASNEVVKIDTHNLCVFCLCESDTSINFDLKSWFRVLSYIQPNWTLGDGTKYKFVIGRKVCDTPPVCSACESEIVQIENFHQKLLDLEERIREVKIKLEIHAENVRGKMRADFVPPSKRRRLGRSLRSGNRREEPADGNYDGRYTELVLWLRNNTQVSEEVSSDTINFLSQLQGSSFDLMQEGHVEANPSVAASASPVVQVKDDLPLFETNCSSDETMTATEDEGESEGVGVPEDEDQSVRREILALHSPPNIVVQPSVPITLTPNKSTELERKRGKKEGAGASHETLRITGRIGARKCVPPGGNVTLSNDHDLGTKKRKSATKPTFVVLISKPGEAEDGIKVQAEAEEFEDPLDQKADNKEGSEDSDSDSNSDSVQCETVESRLEISAALKRKHEKTKLIWVPAKQGYVPCPRVSLKRQKCDFCGVSILQDEMPSHLASHVGEDYSIKCPNPKCQLYFVTKWSRGYRMHIKRAAKRPNKTCWLVASKRKEWTWKTCGTCGEEMESLQMFGLHLEEHETSEKNFYCPVENCGKQFTVKQSVEYHIRSHTLFQAKCEARKSLEKCRLCEKLISGDKMVEHIQNEHNLGEEAIFRCQHCQHTVSSRDDLVNHVAKHYRDLNLESVSCDLCQKKNPPVKVTLYSGIGFRKHYFEEHGIGKKWTCRKKGCEFFSLTQPVLKKHVAVVHKGVEPKTWKCEDCFPQRAFYSESKLKAHRITVHIAEPIKCKFCPETFSTFKLLRKHEAVKHTGKVSETFTSDVSNATLTLDHMEGVQPQNDEKKYKCDQCDKAYHSRSVLKVHVKLKHMHSEVMECVCEVCGRKLKGSRSLLEHMRIHTGERPLVCEICGLRFRQGSAWRTHVNSHKTKGDRFKPKGTFDRGGKL